MARSQLLYVAGCNFSLWGLLQCGDLVFQGGYSYTKVRRADYGRSGPTLCQGLTLLGEAFSQHRYPAAPWLSAWKRSLPDKDIGLGPTMPGKRNDAGDAGQTRTAADWYSGRWALWWSKRNLMLQFRGSSQLDGSVDVQQSLKKGKVVIWDKLNDGKDSYVSKSKRLARLG